MKCCTDVHCVLESQKGSAKEPKKCAASPDNGFMARAAAYAGLLRPASVHYSVNFKCTKAEHLPKSLEKPNHPPHPPQEPQKFSRGMFVDYQNADYAIALKDKSLDDLVRCKVKGTTARGGKNWVQLQFGDLWLAPNM